MKPTKSPASQKTPDSAASSAHIPGRSLQLALAAAQAAEDNRGQDVIVLDLRNLTCIFDYFVIASGTSRRQLHAMSDDIDDRLCKELKDKRMGIEGYQGSSWVLLDYGTVVVHLFEEDAREYYAIEKLWGEAEAIPWRDLVAPRDRLAP